MKCFNHHETDAVGMCKHCHKGLCNECLTVTTGGVACTATCADVVTRVDSLVRKNVNASRSKVLLITPVFLFLIGAVFIYLGVQYLNEGMNRMFFLLVIGGLFFLWGLMSIIAVLKRLNENNK